MLLTISSDITERREFRTAATAWDDVFRHNERGIVVGSANGETLELLNPVFAQMLGYQVAELAGTPLIEVFAPSVRSEVRSKLKLVARTGQQTFEALCIKKGGATLPVLVEATLLKSAGEANLKRIEADQSNEAKSKFLSRMSHEFRTPLNVILGFAQVMQLDEMTPRQDESAGHILQAGRHLLRLIDETLDISKVEAGHLGIMLEAVGVANAVDEVFVLMQPLAKTKGVRLLREGSNPSCDVVADRQRLKQVLLNLVANGINYNVRGGCLEVGCHRRESVVEISISDTGIGIPEGSSERLFAPFDRLGQEGGEVEGTGLGLSLSKGLVEAMGGTISAAKNPGEGSTFTLTLKVSELPDASPPLVTDSLTVSQRPAGLILYIEEHLANLPLIEYILALRPGLQVLPAMQAVAAIQLARHHHPDLIILDVQLPDLSADETLHRLQRSPQTRDIPVVVVGANISPRRLQRFMDLGARTCLERPLNIAELLKTLDDLLPRPKDPPVSI